MIENIFELKTYLSCKKELLNVLQMLIIIEFAKIFL